MRQPLAKRTLFAAWLVVGLSGASVPAGGTEPCYYTWVLLPRAGGLGCYGQAINNLAWVTGFATSGGDHDRAFVWRPDTGMSVLLPMPPGVTGMTAYDINDLGHVVGKMEVPGTGLTTVPFFWDGATVHTIEMPAGGYLGFANAINNSDQVVGRYGAATGQAHAFRWESGVFTDIGVMIPVSSEATAINELGEIAGYATYPGYVPHAFRIAGGVVEWLPEPAGFLQTFARSLNNNGLTVGSGRNESNQWRGLLWTSEGVHVVEPPTGAESSGFAQANDAGRALGGYGIGSEISLIAWQDGVITFLDPMFTPPPPRNTGNAHINMSGQITFWVTGGTIILNPHWTLGDLTGDCHVALDDLLLLLSNFGSPQGSFPRGDVDLDGDVDLNDLTMLLSHWGE